MSFSKVIPLGAIGSLTLADASGALSAEISANYAVPATGTVIGVDIKENVDGKALVDAAFVYIESKAPAGWKGLEEGVKAEILAFL